MVDNTIALQVRPFQMPDVGQIYGQAQTLQANRMRMEEAQETARERNALRGLMASGVDLNTPEGLNQLRRAAPMLAPQFEQAASQRAYQTAQTARLRAQTDADRFKLYRGQLGGVNDQTAWDDWRGRVVQEFPQFAGSIPQRFSPQARSDVAGGAELLIQRATADAAAAARPNEFERALLGAGIRPGSPEWQDAMRGRATSLTGGRAPREQAFIGPDGRPMIVNLDTGVFRFAQETPMGAAPGAAQPAAPNAMLASPTAAAPAPAPAVPAPSAAEAPPVDLRRPAAPVAAPVAAPTTFAEMQAAQLARQLAQRRGEQAVTQEGAPARVAEAGETTGAQETARLEARSDAARSEELGRLRSAIPELRAMTAPGGLLTEATGGGLNALIDRIAGLFNYATPGAQATGRLEPIAGEILRTVPRFEGPQSNADVALYQKMAGDLANPELPNATRIAAAREIQRLMEKRLQQIETSEIAAPPPPPARNAQSVRTGQTQAPTAFREGQTATGPNGQRIKFRNGQWVPMR